MSNSTVSNMDAPHLQPIKVGFFETLRLIRKSYVNPLRHAQELHERYGNA